MDLATASIAARISERSSDLPVVLWPADIERRYQIADSTRARWEKSGLLPARDVHIGENISGWRRQTIEQAERRPAAVR